MKHADVDRNAHMRQKKTAGGLVGGFLKSGERVMRATLSPPVA